MVARIAVPVATTRSGTMPADLDHAVRLFRQAQLNGDPVTIREAAHRVVARLRAAPLDNELAVAAALAGF